MTLDELKERFRQSHLFPVPMINAPPTPDEPLLRLRGDQTDLALVEADGVYPELYTRRLILGELVARKAWFALMTREELNNWRP